MLSNVIVDVTIPRRLFVFGQSRAKVSAGFTNVRRLAVAAFDLVYCFLSVLRIVFVLDIRDRKQPGRVCGRRREKTSEVWVENVVQSKKNKCLSKLPSRLVAEVGRLH